MVNMSHQVPVSFPPVFAWYFSFQFFDAFGSAAGRACGL